MQKSHILFESSPWFILLCLLLGAVYAFILYQKKGPWSKRTNYTLAFLRFFLASFLAILILEPLIEQIKNSYAPPTYVIAVDNSISIGSNEKDSIENVAVIEKIEDLHTRLEGTDYEVSIRTFDNAQNPESIADIAFNHPSSDLHQMIQSIESDYEGRNLAGVVLLSDGIYNKGISPEYSSYKFPIYTVGLGDTIPKKDINLKTLYYNKVSYQGNKFPVVAEIEHNGFENSNTKIYLKKDGQTIDTKNLAFGENIQRVEFLIDAKDVGLQHYIVQIDTVAGEFSAENNIGHSYVDIIEGKEKILLAAASPHPDIKAILNALEKNQNYEITLYIPGIHELPSEILASPDFNAIILHQIPEQSNNDDPFIKSLMAKSIPTFYILGNKSDIASFNKQNNIMSIQQIANEKDLVLPYLAPNFNLFQLEETFNESLSYFPQVVVPFGEITLRGNYEVLLFQQIGKIISEKPLLVIGNNQDSKGAVLIGEGIWQWRLQEFAETGNADGFDELISKTVQYLSSKEDKRRFKVYPIKNEFTDTEPIVFESEIYDELFEPIYNQTIQLEITDEEGSTDSYQFTTNPANTRYRITGLEAGIYKYEAMATVEGRKYKSEGEFSIEDLQLENLNLVANHSLLRKISSNSRGSFYLPGEINSLENDLLKKEAKSIIYTEEQYLPLVNIWWIFLLLVSLISVEWFLRKYNGSY